MTGLRHRPSRFAWLISLMATAGLALSVAPAQAAPPLDPTAAVAGVGPAVVNVDTQMNYAGAVGAGTGIVLDPSGIILTNNHVISGATAVSAMSIANQQSYSAEVLGYDRTHDVAVLQLHGVNGLPVANLGDSDRVAVGDPVIAMGNAGGQGGTPSAVPGAVTALGTAVSATDELTGSSETLTGMIQASTALRPGDSGGPMVNSAGQVIGMNTAASDNYKLAQQGGGQGYAIPINQALAIADQIRAGAASDTVHIGPTPFLGIGVVDAGGHGAKVVRVVPDTPAAEAGLSPDDVITAVDGTAIDSATTLTRVLDLHHPGDVVQLDWTGPLSGPHNKKVTLAVGPAG